MSKRVSLVLPYWTLTRASFHSISNLLYVIHINMWYFLLEPWPSPNWPSKCLTPKTWWPPVIRATDDIWPWPLFSVAVCPWKRLMNRCSTSKTKTAPISWNGSLTMLRRPFAIFLHEDWKWLRHSLEIPRLFKNCSRGLANSSRLCSGERLSCIGTLAKVCTIKQCPSDFDYCALYIWGTK